MRAYPTMGRTSPARVLKLAQSFLLFRKTSMDRAEFNTICNGLTATTHVVQWGDSDVWKVGGKVFAICGFNHGLDAFVFKASDITFNVLKDQPGIRPAPYMASRGLKWLQHYGAPGLSDEELHHHILQSYRMVASGLSAKKRRELQIDQ